MSTNNKQQLPWQLRLIRTGFTIGGAISPKLTGKAAYALFQIPLFHAPFKDKHRQMREAEMLNLPYRDGQIATYHWPGDGHLAPSGGRVAEHAKPRHGALGLVAHS